MFDVGEAVVCVDASPHNRSGTLIRKGAVYFIDRMRICPYDNSPQVSLMGIQCPTIRGRTYWYVERFRKIPPIEDRKVTRVVEREREDA